MVHQPDLCRYRSHLVLQSRTFANALRNPAMFARRSPSRPNEQRADSSIRSNRVIKLQIIEAISSAIHPAVSG